MLPHLKYHIQHEFGKMKETPNQITINSDQTSQFDIRIDTGIR